MAFFKKVKQIIDGKWHPQSITVGKPVTTDEVAKQLAIESTVSPADTFAVLKSLGGVLSGFMANGSTVKLDGLGTFYYTAVSTGNGMDSADEVTARQITGVRVRFLPETRRTANNQVTTRSLINDDIFWEEWGRKPADTEDDRPDIIGGGETPDPAI